MYYTYDGTFQGLLSVVYERFRGREYRGTISRRIEGMLFQGREVKTCPEWSERVYRRVEESAGRSVMNKLLMAFLSEKSGIEDEIFSYIYGVVRRGGSIERSYTRSVEAVDKAAFRVSREAHKFKGFVRFRRLADDTYYAVIEPEGNVLPVIAGHFIERFADQNFVIHDVVREVALVYCAKERIGEIKRLTGVSEELLTYGRSTHLHREEEGYIDLWRTFFHSVSIEGRENPDCQRNFMPKKYWKNLVEVNKK